MQVAKWGNSLAIRLPMALVKRMNLAEGDEVELSVSGPGQLRLAAKPSKEVVVAALRARVLPAAIALVAVGLLAALVVG